jgi:hypothetical protein
MLKTSASTADVPTSTTDTDDARVQAAVLDAIVAAETAAAAAVLATRLAQSRLDVRSYLASRAPRLVG